MRLRIESWSGLYVPEVVMFDWRKKLLKGESAATKVDGQVAKQIRLFARWAKMSFGSSRS